MQPPIDLQKELSMMKVFSAGRKLIPGLLILLFSGSLLAETTNAANYVKPYMTLTKYNKVMVKPLKIEDVEVIKPPWESEDPDEWDFEEGSGEVVKKLFMDAMRKELEVVGGFPLVSDSADDVLRIEVELLSITPYVKPGLETGDDGYEVETLGSGELVVSAEIRDSRTRELLILVEGERTIGDKYRKLTQENHIKNLRKLFEGWGVKIREALNEGR
jgi:hypothetical protein